MLVAGSLGSSLGGSLGCVTPNLPTKIIPAKIARLELSGEFPMGLKMPTLKNKIALESNSLKSTTLLRRLAYILIYLYICLFSLSLSLYIYIYIYIYIPYFRSRGKSPPVVAAGSLGRPLGVLLLVAYT